MMTIKIDGKIISNEQLEAWQRKRAARVLRTLKQKPPPEQNASAMLERLTQIKLQYTYKEMHRLLAGKLMLCESMMDSAVALSGGKRKFALTQIEVEGLSAAEATHALDRLMLEPSAENNRVNLWACPDHYALRPGEGGMLEVIETCGSSPLPTQFFIQYGDETALQTPRNEAYPYQSVGVARSKGGKLIGGVRHQFRDTAKGMEARLAVEFPALLPTSIVKAHQMHLACEFSRWLGWIAGDHKNV